MSQGLWTKIVCICFSTTILIGCSGVESLEDKAKELGLDPWGLISDVGSKKVLICHVPDGNPQEAHAIEVSISAVPAHLAHGDYLGECKPSEDPIEDTPPVEPQPPEVSPPEDTPQDPIEELPPVETPPEVTPPSPPLYGPPTPVQPNPPTPPVVEPPSPPVDEEPPAPPTPPVNPPETPKLWHQQAYVKPSDPQMWGGFGGFHGNNNVAIQGDTMVVGSASATVEGKEYAGLVYVFSRSDGIWSQSAVLKAHQPQENGMFGYSVSTSGDTIVVGASYEDQVGVNSGAVYVFVRSGSSWTQQSHLTASDSTSMAYFGGSVDVEGDRLVVGAGGHPHSGAVYIFERSEGIWSQQRILKSPKSKNWQGFGASVSLAHDTLVVGAYGDSSSRKGIIYQAPESDDEAAFLSGAAHVYRRAGSQWILEAILKSSSSLAEDIFGINVSTDGETVVVGAPGVQSLTGAAFVFEKVEGLWSETAKLTASNAGSQDRFGWAVGVSASRVVVGAFHEDSSQTTVTNGSASASDNNSSNAGAVYVYHRDDGLWTQEAYLKPSKLQPGLGMGKTLAICGDSIVASSGGDNSAQNYITHGETSPDDTDLPDAGAVYVFKR